MARDLGGRLVLAPGRCAGKLQLAARLQRDARVVGEDRDGLAVLLVLVLHAAGVASERIEDGADAGLAVIGHRREGFLDDPDLLVLDADAEIGPRLLGTAEVFEELIPTPDRLEQPGRAFQVEGHLGQ